MGKHFEWWNEGIYAEDKGPMFGYTRAICYHETPEARMGWLDEEDDDYDITEPPEKYRRMCDILIALYFRYGWPKHEVSEYGNGYQPDWGDDDDK